MTPDEILKTFSKKRTEHNDYNAGCEIFKNQLRLKLRVLIFIP